MQTCSCPYEASASYIQVLTMYDTEVFLIIRDLVSPCNPVNNTEPNDGVSPKQTVRRREHICIQQIDWICSFGPIDQASGAELFTPLFDCCLLLFPDARIVVKSGQMHARNKHSQHVRHHVVLHLIFSTNFTIKIIKFNNDKMKIG